MTAIAHPSPRHPERRLWSKTVSHSGPPELCRFQEALGISEVCPEEACPFWEQGGAVVPGRCAFDRLDLSHRTDLAAVLVRIRDDIKAAGTREGEHEARLLFFRRLNAGHGD